MNDLGDTVPLEAHHIVQTSVFLDGCYTLDSGRLLGDGWNGNTFAVNGLWGATIASGTAEQTSTS